MKGIRFGGAITIRSVCAVVTVAALIGPVSACASPVPPEGPWLAFPAGDALGLSGVGIKGMAADGSGRVVISGGYEADIVPDPFSTISWSADGAWLAFGGSKGPRKGIYELHPDGSGTRFLHGTDGGKNPVFSPDGSKLAFVRSNLKVGAATTWLADADGRKAVRLTPRSRAVEYLPSSFSPDGSVLAVTRKALRTNSRECCYSRSAGVRRFGSWLGGHPKRPSRRTVRRSHSSVRRSLTIESTQRWSTRTSTS